MSDSGELESWEYQGGTFTAVGSWLAVGGRTLVDLEKKSTIKVNKEYALSIGISTQDRFYFNIPNERKVVLLFSCESGIYQDDKIGVVTDNYADFSVLVPINTPTIFEFTNAEAKTFGINAQSTKILKSGTVTLSVYYGAYIELQELDSIPEKVAVNTQSIKANAQNISDLKGEINGINENFTDVLVPVSAEVLKRHKPAQLLDDGSLRTDGITGDWQVVSDFIEVKGAVKSISSCFNKVEADKRCVALAFYSESNEESFISSFKEYTEELVSSWVKYNGSIIIPEGAKYIRIAGNTTLAPESPNIEMYEKAIKDQNIYANPPSEYYEYFTYDVDSALEDIDDKKKTTEVQDVSSISKDNGFIRIPESYSRNGTPTRLVIINHGAGGKVTDSSTEAGNASYSVLLQKKGYAVLVVNGVPENMRNENYMSAEHNGSAAHMGSWIFIRSVLAAYNYVTTKYNIAKDGCYVIGQSMGGVSSLNLAFSGVIPVKALALDAPVIDAFHDAYFGGGWSGGNLGGKTAAIFAWIYQWDYCNFDDNTYTIPIGEYNIFGQTYNVQTEETKPLANLYQNTQDMAILWHLNETKMIGYNGYKTGDFLVKNLDENYVYNLSTDNDDKYYGKKLPCPCKIWFGSGDNVNNQEIAHRFINKCRNAGSIIMFRTCPTTRHCVWDELEAQPDNTDISVVEDGITCSPYAVELWNWLKRYDGIK